MSASEIITRRRKWSAATKASLLAEVEAEGGNLLPGGTEPSEVVGGATPVPAIVTIPEVTPVDANQTTSAQADLFTLDQAEPRDRALIEQLIAATRLYAASDAVVAAAQEP